MGSIAGAGNEDQVRQAAERAVMPTKAGFPHLLRSEAMSGKNRRIGDTAVRGGSESLRLSGFS